MTKNSSAGLLALICLGALGVAIYSHAAAEEDGRKYMYCKTENFRNEVHDYVCNWGETESKACRGWQHGSISKKVVARVDNDYKYCDSNGKSLTRVLLK